ncbi:MAG TPA: metal-dependent hydrolase [Candidatus Andersenbacteria bacterium]|nr:metal-dependent hydrolase [Candidatus Andersenbacteria bacterium]
MMGTTHQMVALLAAFWVLTLSPVSLEPILAVIAIFAVMIGALTPDLDHPATNLLRRTIGGKVVHRLFSQFSGGHRHFTHGVIGILAIYFFLQWIIYQFFQENYHPQLVILLHAFMIGYISHPIADTLTDQGVPWLWPIPLSIKLPPGPEELRVTTGSFVEVVLLRGGLLIAFFFLASSHWNVLALLFRG